MGPLLLACAAVTCATAAGVMAYTVIADHLSGIRYAPLSWLGAAFFIGTSTAGAIGAAVPLVVWLRGGMA